MRKSANDKIVLGFVGVAGRGYGALMQAFGYHPVNGAPGRQRGICNNAHQPFDRAAINEGNSRFSQGLPEHTRTIGIFFSGPKI